MKLFGGIAELVEMRRMVCICFALSGVDAQVEAKTLSLRAGLDPHSRQDAITRVIRFSHQRLGLGVVHLLLVA